MKNINIKKLLDNSKPSPSLFGTVKKKNRNQQKNVEPHRRFQFSRNNYCKIKCRRALR